MHKLTIAVATYNRAKMLTEMLDSILLQTYKDFYVIIYDNCSQDNTSEAVKPYLSDERFTYHRHDTVINNFNYALDNCKTDYLLIVHDDDIMLPDMTNEEIAILDSYSDVSIVSTNMNSISADGKTIINQNVYDVSTINQDCLINSKEYIKILIDKTNIISCPTVMFRMSVIREHNLKFQSDLGGGCDCFLWLELNQLNYKFYYLNKALYNYRIHESQDSARSYFLMSLLRKPVYFLLIKNNYPECIIKEWMQLAENNFILEFQRYKNRRKIFKEIKNKLLFNDKKDYYLLFRIYYILFVPSFIREPRKYIILLLKKFLPKSVYLYLKKLYHRKSS